MMLFFCPLPGMVGGKLIMCVTLLSAKGESRCQDKLIFYPFRLRELQKAQTDVLVDFHNFCIEHDLTYFLAYETLLGAVRHKGFIPWDYDIDTFMTRSEYEKFMKIQTLLPSDINVWEVCYSNIYVKF